MSVTAAILFFLGLGGREAKPVQPAPAVPAKA
jgi:hypothetical protein